MYCDKSRERRDPSMGRVCPTGDATSHEDGLIRTDHESRKFVPPPLWTDTYSRGTSDDAGRKSHSECINRRVNKKRPVFRTDRPSVRDYLSEIIYHRRTGKERSGIMAIRPCRCHPWNDHLISTRLLPNSSYRVGTATFLTSRGLG